MTSMYSIAGILVFLFVGVTITTATMPVTVPISSPSDPLYQYLGRFVVDEYNKQQNQSHLYFVRVYGGTEYFVPPTSSEWITYTLFLNAINCTNHGAPGNYTAKVTDARVSSTAKKLFFESLIPKYN